MAPQTKRYCRNCKKPTWFKYDKMVRHSHCRECGFNSLIARKLKGVAK